MKRIVSLLTALLLVISLLPAALCESQAEWEAACTMVVEANAWVYALHTDEADGVAPIDQLAAGKRVRSNGLYDEWMYVDYMENGAHKTGAVKAALVESLLPAATPMPTAVPQYGNAVVNSKDEPDTSGSWVERYGSYTCLVYNDGVADEVMTSSLTFNNLGPDKQVAMVKAGSASSVTLRSKASSKSSAVIKCPVGSIVPVFSINGDWAKVAYGEAEGYLATSNLQFDIVVDEILGYGILTMENPTSINSIINIRAKTSTNSAKVAEWFPGNEVVVIRRTGDWYEIEAYGTRGFVKAQYVELVGDE